MTGPAGGDGPAGVVVLIHGDEPFLVDRCVAEMVGGWRGGLTNPMNDEVFRAPAVLDELRQSLATPAFLDPHRVILVWDPPACIASGRRLADAPRLVAALTDRDPTAAVCLAIHGTLAASNPVLIFVRRVGTVRLVNRPRGRALDVHLDTELGRHGLRCGTAARARLRALAAADLGQLDQEVEKLSVAAGPGGRIDPATADALIADGGRSEIYHLLDAVMEGAAPALGHLADLERRRAAPPPLLVASLGRWLRELLQLHAQTERGIPVSRAATGRPPWMLARLERQVRQTDPAALATALERLADLDWAIRTGEVDPPLGLQAFVAGLASGTGPAHRSA
ncbi:MAG TPA: hypothetical protein VMW47_04470 [Verrucomicrobiae bacterium]|nr:hypothetical protein [Verrucomicrobiae bacterium]